MTHEANSERILRWALGLLLAIESALFLFAPGDRTFAHSGMPHTLRFIIGGLELGAAVLFLISPTVLLGGYLLIGTFALAGAVHILHGQPNIGTLVGYTIAVLLVLTHRKRESSTG